MKIYDDLTEANKARQIEWNGDKTSALYRATELGGECGEVLNVVKKLERERLGIAGSRETVEHLGEELADVVICVSLLALAYGIDIDKEVPKKFNKTSKAVGLNTFMYEGVG